MSSSNSDTKQLDESKLISSTEIKDMENKLKERVEEMKKEFNNLESKYQSALTELDEMIKASEVSEKEREEDLKLTASNKIIKNILVTIKNQQKINDANWNREFGFLKDILNSLPSINFTGLYSARIFSDVADIIISTSPVICSIQFSVDAPITMLGVQLPTQNGAVDKMYEEEVKVNMDDPGVVILKSQVIKHRVAYNSLQEVRFQEPIALQINKVYMLFMKLIIPGNYPVATAASTSVKVGHVTFNFIVEGAIRDGLLRAIIFQ